MDYLKFEWDKKKEKANLKKHGNSLAVQFLDPDHSDEEDRFILLGTSYKLNTLVVCHCFRVDEMIIRIISARKADKAEIKAYWSHNK